LRVESWEGSADPGSSGSQGICNAKEQTDETTAAE